MAIQGIETGAFQESKLHAFTESKLHARGMNGPTIGTGWNFVNPSSNTVPLFSQIGSASAGTDAIPFISGKYVYIASLGDSSLPPPLPTTPVLFIPGTGYSLLNTAAQIAAFGGGSVGSVGFILAALWGSDVSMKFRLVSQIMLPGIYTGTFGQSVQAVGSGAGWPSSCTAQVISADYSQKIDVTPGGAGTVANVFTPMTLDSNLVFGRRTSFFIQVSQAARPDPNLKGIRTTFAGANTIYCPQWTMNRVTPE